MYDIIIVGAGPAGLTAAIYAKRAAKSVLVLEAKAYGLPVVMYDLPYLTLTMDGKGLLTSPNGEVDNMVEHLIDILTKENFKCVCNVFFI